MPAAQEGSPSGRAPARAARAGVSSACTAGAVFSSSRTCSMNPLVSTRAAAFPRIPAIHPVETATPASWHSSSAARYTGM